MRMLQDKLFSGCLTSTIPPSSFTPAPEPTHCPSSRVAMPPLQARSVSRLCCSLQWSLPNTSPFENCIVPPNPTVLPFLISDPQTAPSRVGIFLERNCTMRFHSWVCTCYLAIVLVSFLTRCVNSTELNILSVRSFEFLVWEQHRTHRVGIQQILVQLGVQWGWRKHPRTHS